jgi:hypothetical protein
MTTRAARVLREQPRIVNGWLALERYQGADGKATAEHMAAINALRGTLRPLAAADVKVRGMFLMNDMPMHESPWFIRKFDLAALAQAVPLVPGKPVLVNHTTYGHDGLPVGRFFAAELEAREDGSQWVAALFYMLADAQGEAIAARIDGGLYTECSPTIYYDRLYCSVCGAEDLDCEHAPGKVYEGVKCYAVMSAITDVLEGSIAWAGQQRETGFYVAAGREATVEDTEKVLQLVRDGRLSTGADPFSEWWGGSPGT